MSRVLPTTRLKMPVWPRLRSRDGGRLGGSSPCGNRPGGRGHVPLSGALHAAVCSTAATPTLRDVVAGRRPRAPAGRRSTTGVADAHPAMRRRRPALLRRARRRARAAGAAARRPRRRGDQEPRRPGRRDPRGDRRPRRRPPLVRGRDRRRRGARRGRLRGRDRPPRRAADPRARPPCSRRTTPAVGVKNGINAFGKKNFVGSFAPPHAVLNDFDLLLTLSDRDWRAGISEAMKVALLKDAPFFAWIEHHAARPHRPLARRRWRTWCTAAPSCT